MFNHSKPQKSEWFGTPENFQPVHDGLESQVFYVDVDLSTARTSANPLSLNFSGNSFYVDANPSDGVATAQFQHRDAGNAGSPFYVFPGFACSLTFTRVLFTNAAQAGKKIRVIYGVDIDFAQFTAASSSPVTFPTFYPGQENQHYWNIQGGVFEGSRHNIAIAAAGIRHFYFRLNTGATNADVYSFTLNQNPALPVANATIEFYVGQGSAVGFVEQSGVLYGTPNPTPTLSASKIGDSTTWLNIPSTLSKTLFWDFTKGPLELIRYPVRVTTGVNWGVVCARITNNGAAAGNLSLNCTFAERP